MGNGASRGPRRGSTPASSPLSSRWCRCGSPSSTAASVVARARRARARLRRRCAARRPGSRVVLVARAGRGLHLPRLGGRIAVLARCAAACAAPLCRDADAGGRRAPAHRRRAARRARALQRPTLSSLEALAYLIVVGSLIGFTAYTWLLRNARMSLVGTYAFVNPVVAVLLGWAFNNETLSCGRWSRDR